MTKKSVHQSSQLSEEEIVSRWEHDNFYPNLVESRFQKAEMEAMTEAQDQILHKEWSDRFVNPAMNGEYNRYKSMAKASIPVKTPNIQGVYRRNDEEFIGEK